MRRLFCLLVATPLLLLVGCDSGGTNPFDIPPILPEDADPAVSPDGSRLAYWHKEIDETREGAYPTGLYVLDLATGERSLVRTGGVWSPDWNPDGEWLVVKAGNIAVMRPDGSDFRYITEHSGFFPAWSPDGMRIAYDTPYEDSRGANVIWLVNPDGTNLKDISEHGVGEWRNADWSPEGRIIHYRYLSSGVGSQLFAMDSTGANPVQLTANDFRYNRDPAVSPDGRHVAWAAQEGNGRLALRLMRSDGTGQRRLVRLAAGGAYPAWTPDGERIVFQALAPERDRLVLWAIARDGSDGEQLTF